MIRYGLRTWRRGWLRDRRGVAATEAALAISLILMPLILGVIDYGALLAAEARLDRALQAAVYYVWNNPTSFTTAGISSAGTAGISSAANAGFGGASPTLTVTSTMACSCVSSGYSPVSTVSCSGSCTSGQTVAAYVTITASASFTLPVAVSYLASPLSRSVSGTIRTQ
jgi:Flp pilus assembly protein TadG